MENKSKPLSIRIIFWFTEIIFWLLTVVSTVAIIFSIASIFGFNPPDLNLHVQAPFTFDLDAAGYYHAESGEVSVRLVDASSKINFVGTPDFIARPIAFAIIIIVVLAFMAMLQFRLFIRNVYRGLYFDSHNIRYLKRMAWWIIGIWIATKVYFAVFYYIISSHIEFEGIHLTGNFNSDGYLFMIALFIYVLSHIFQKGMELEEEQKLTV